MLKCCEPIYLFMADDMQRNYHYILKLLNYIDLIIKGGGCVFIIFGFMPLLSLLGVALLSIYNNRTWGILDNVIGKIC